MVGSESSRTSDRAHLLVDSLKRQGFLRDPALVAALLTVPREEFVRPSDVAFAYDDFPMRIPGTGEQTISAPHAYALAYEALALREGERVLEIGTGSGYGAALARMLVGPTGCVVTVEVDPVTSAFGQDNLLRTGYHDVTVLVGDGTRLPPDTEPFDAIVVAAAVDDVPPGLYSLLTPAGRLVAPVGSRLGQRLVRIQRDRRGAWAESFIAHMHYVPLVDGEEPRPAD